MAPKIGKLMFYSITKKAVIRAAIVERRLRVVDSIGRRNTLKLG